LQTPSTSISASLSSAVDSTFSKEKSYTDLQPLTLFDSNTITSMMQTSDDINSLPPTTSESSNSVSQVNTDGFICPCHKMH